MHEDDSWALYVNRKATADGGKFYGRGPAPLRATLISLYDEGHRSGLIEFDPPVGRLRTIYFTRTAHHLNRLIRWTLREHTPPALRH